MARRGRNKWVPFSKEWFLTQVEECGGCWLWPSTRPDGYGQLTINYKKKLAHRVAYELFIGSIPKGNQVCHDCDVRNCVQPRHLFTGTNQDNVDDMMQKGRHRGNRRLCEAQVHSIRADNRMNTVIAAEYGVTPSHIGSIKKKRFWKHL